MLRCRNATRRRSSDRLQSSIYGIFDHLMKRLESIAAGRSNSLRLFAVVTSLASTID
jgi:hypothetical protein